MEEIELKLEGRAFDEGMPLHLVATSLTEVQAIIDKSALYLLNRERLTPEDRSYYSVNATSLRQGSFLADLSVIAAGAQQVLPGFVALGPGAIWQYAKETWSFLEFVFRNSKIGDMPNIEAHDNSTVTVHYGDVSNTYNAPVIQIAKMSVGHYRELLGLLRYPGVENIEFGSKGSPELSVSKADKDLLENPTHIDREVMEVEGDIYSFNKHSNAGRLEVEEDENRVTVKSGVWERS